MAKCERPYEICVYLNNLCRLGLVEYSNLASLTNKDLYKPLKEHPYIAIKNKDSMAEPFGFKKAKIEEGYVALTDYGKAFGNVCLGDIHTVITQES